MQSCFGIDLGTTYSAIAIVVEKPVAQPGELLIYDCGGGTTDIALLEIRRSVAEVLVAVSKALLEEAAPSVVHCDVKPTNVMISDDGRVVIVDWGIGGSVAPSPSLGTPAYMAPESPRAEEKASAQYGGFSFDDLLCRFLAAESVSRRVPESRSLEMIDCPGLGSDRATEQRPGEEKASAPVKTYRVGFLGRTGVGKSSAINALLGAQNADERSLCSESYRGSAAVIDPKGEALTAHQLFEGVIAFGETGAGKTSGLFENTLGILRQNEQRDDSFWTTSAQRYLRHAITALWAANRCWSLADLCDALLAAPTSLRAERCDYWLQQWPRLSDKTRSIIESITTNILDKSHFAGVPNRIADTMSVQDGMHRTRRLWDFAWWLSGSAHGTARWSTDTDLREAGLFSDRSHCAGRRRLPRSVHTAVFAPAGTGKGVSIVIPNLLTYSGSTVVIDFKGELFRATAERRRKALGHRVVVLDPFSLVTEKPDRFNPFDLIDLDCHTLLDECRALAEEILVRPGEEKDPHWNDSTEIWIAAMVASVGFNTSHAQELTYREMAGVLATANGQLALLDTPGLCERARCIRFDAADLLARGMTIYLVLPPDQLRAQTGLLRLWIGSLLRGASSQWAEEGGRVHFVLDEPATRGRMQTFDDALAVYRGYGVRLWFCYQLMGQFERSLPKWRDQTLLDNTTQVFFGIRDMETVERVSKWLGNCTIVARSVRPELRRTAHERTCPTNKVGEAQILAMIRQGLQEIPKALRTVPDIVRSREELGTLVKPTQRVIAILDRVKLYLRLMGLNGWSQAELAEHLGISPAAVSKLLAISRLLCLATARVGSENWTEQGRKLLKPDEVMRLSDGVAITFVPGVPPIRTRVVRYYEDRLPVQSGSPRTRRRSVRGQRRRPLWARSARRPSRRDAAMTQPGQRRVLPAKNDTMNADRASRTQRGRAFLAVSAS